MLASSGEITDPCPVPLSLIVTASSSCTPARSHFWIRRMMRRSPIRCSTKRISHSWLTVSKNDWMSASSIQFTLVPVIPTASASSASCWPRPGRNPLREPEEVFLVDRVQHHGGRALAILSSRAAIASGRCRPSAFGVPSGGTAAADTLHAGPGRAGPRASARGLPRSPPTSCHPHRGRHLASTRGTPSAAHRH